MQETADKLGAKYNAVQAAARRYGIKFVRAPRPSKYKKARLTWLRPLSAEAHSWLMGQLPEGSSIAELVCAIITDAYHDDQLP